MFDENMQQHVGLGGGAVFVDPLLKPSKKFGSASAVKKKRPLGVKNMNEMPGVGINTPKGKCSMNQMTKGSQGKSKSSRRALGDISNNTPHRSSIRSSKESFKVPSKSAAKVPLKKKGPSFHDSNTSKVNTPHRTKERPSDSCNRLVQQTEEFTFPADLPDLSNLSVEVFAKAPSLLGGDAFDSCPIEETGKRAVIPSDDRILDEYSAEKAEGSMDFPLFCDDDLGNPNDDMGGDDDGFFAIDPMDILIAEEQNENDGISQKKVTKANGLSCSQGNRTDLSATSSNQLVL